ncbi:MAG: hypothetical protein ACRC33_22115 [Gemmataceae bacterium]
MTDAEPEEPDFMPLRSDRLIETAERVAGRVQARSPDAGLAVVAATLAGITADDPGADRRGAGARRG